MPISLPSTATDPLLVEFESGELIFEAGELGDKAYIIESGQIDVFVKTGNQPLSLRSLGAGEVLGEMAVIDAAPRSASARACVPTRCLVISSQQIAERIDETDAVVRLLITTLLDRMRSLTYSSVVTCAGLKRAIADETTIVSSQYWESRSDCSDADDVDNEDVIAKMRLESELRAALKSNHLIPYYQALVDLQTEKIVGFELLVRWQSPSRGYVSPGLFISMAEETSLIIPVGCWALSAAVQAIQSFQAEVDCPLFITVNISAKQFLAPDFIEQLVQLVPVPCIKCIKLEVTESVLMAGGNASQTLQICRDMGFCISLDDFGTGFSSLSYLSELEVDSVKIDQSFIRKLLENKRTFMLTKTMINLTHDLGMQSIAEGIETATQRDTLKRLGCHIGQGYLFSPPVAFAEALALLKQAP